MREQPSDCVSVGYDGPCDVTAAAAAWLDIRYPGWADLIDLDRFSIYEAENCIGWFLTGRRTGWMRLRREYALDGGRAESAFSSFQDNWCRRILERRTTQVEEQERELVLV